MTSLPLARSSGSLVCALTLAIPPAVAWGESGVGPTIGIAPAPAAPAGAGDAALLKDALGLSGSLRAAGFSKDKSFGGETGYAVGSLWMVAAPRDVWGIGTYFDGRVQGANLTRSYTVSWDVREAYARTAFRSFDVKAGRQIIVWGRADKVNPTDTWSTRDFTLLAPNDDDQHLGVASVQVSWSAGAFRATGLWQPEWRYPGLPRPPLPVGVSLRNLPPSAPARQFGMKIDHSGAGPDWSLSYSHAIDRTPDLALLPCGPPEMALGFAYRAVDTVGADAAVPVGKVGLRGEVAYARTQDRGGTDPLIKNSNVLLVLGGERTWAGVLNANVQYLYRRTLGFSAPSFIADDNRRLLAEQVDLLSNQLAPDMHGASLRINCKLWNETLETEVAGVVWFKKGDTAIRPKLTYAFNDRVKGIVGGEIYRGPNDSFFGRLNQTSAAYTELQLGF